MGIREKGAFKRSLLTRCSLVGFSLLTSVAAAPGATAQDSDAFTWNGSAALVTDYRFRGLSLSSKDTAFQGSFTVSHESGFYVSTWGSSIEQFNGAELELDIYGGYSGQLGNLSTNVGFYAYTYPGASDNTDYYEVFGSLGGTIETVSWTLGSNYAFEQDGTGDQDNIYIYLSTSAPLGTSNFSVAGNIAYEDGAFGSNKWDWLLGLSYSFDKYSLSVNYIDTANSGTAAGNAGVIGMLSASF